MDALLPQADEALLWYMGKVHETALLCGGRAEVHICHGCLVYTGYPGNTGHQGLQISWDDETLVQRIVVTAITGALCTMATDIMEAHANVLLIELLMHRVCYRAAIRLATVLDSHPLCKPMLTCARRCSKRHLSPIHTLL